MKIGIAGAGVMGRLLAFAYVNHGHQVSLFDQDDDLGDKSCSMAAAGLLLPITELDKSPLMIYQLGIEAIEQHWPSILNQLKNQIYFRTLGSLVLSHPNEQAELTHFVTRIHAKLNVKQFYRVLNQTELLQLEPELTQFNYAYSFPAEGQLDNQQLLAALKDFLYQQGVKWYANTELTECHPKKIITHAAVYDFDWVFDCRGMGGKARFANLFAVRGELVCLHAPQVNIQRPIRFLHPRYSLYIVPRPANMYLVGASEIYTEDYSAISVRSELELLTAAYYLHPAFAEARIIKTITQCRPTFPDHLPKIKYADGFIAVNGLYRHGFLIAPTLMTDIVQWIKTNDLTSLHYPQLWEQL